MLNALLFAKVTWLNTGELANHRLCQCLGLIPALRGQPIQVVVCAGDRDAVGIDSVRGAVKHVKRRRFDPPKGVADSRRKRFWMWMERQQLRTLEDRSLLSSRELFL